MDAALGRLLHMNDRLHAALSCWRAVTEELAQALQQEQVHHTGTSCSFFCQCCCGAPLGMMKARARVCRGEQERRLGPQPGRSRSLRSGSALWAAAPAASWAAQQHPPAPACTVRAATAAIQAVPHPGTPLAQGSLNRLLLVCRTRLRHR